MKDIIVGIILIIVLGLTISYIVRAKRSGVKCIGCHSEKSCGSNGASSCSCGCSECGSDSE